MRAAISQEEYGKRLQAMLDAKAALEAEGTTSVTLRELCKRAAPECNMEPGGLVWFFTQKLNNAERSKLGVQCRRVPGPHRLSERELLRREDRALEVQEALRRRDIWSAYLYAIYVLKQRDDMPHTVENLVGFLGGISAAEATAFLRTNPDLMEFLRTHFDHRSLPPQKRDETLSHSPRPASQVLAHT